MMQEFTIRDYLSVIRRRVWVLIVPFVLTSIVGGIVANLLPARYQAEGTILIESQQIPEDLVRSTVTGLANERVRIVQQRVMTRQNLLGIIREFNLYSDTGFRSQSDKVDQLRRNISIEMIQASAGRTSNTFAINVGFEDKSADLALRVSNELVTLFLDENVRTRTARATETTEFLRSQADDLQDELELLEAQLANYKQENSGALPEQLRLHLDMLERAREQLRTVETELNSYEGELRFLSIEQQAAETRLVSISTPDTLPMPVLSPQQELERQRLELTRLQVRYSDQHPDILAARQQIAALEESILASGRETGLAVGTEPDEAMDEDENVNPTLARIETSISMLNARMETQRQFRNELIAQISDLEQRVARTPNVELALGNLSRDLENTRNKYEELRAKERAAQLSQNLEEDKKAERFVLLEPPVRPEEPSSPNRLLIAAVGPVIGSVIGAGLLILIELLFGRVTRPVVLAKLMGEPPFAVIPRIQTDEDLRRRRTGYAIAGSVALAILASVAATHFLVMPLGDLLTTAISFVT